MYGNSYNIPIDNEETAENYLRSYYRVIEISFSIAIQCKRDIIGGGLLFTDIDE